MAVSKKILYIINHVDWFWSHRLPLAAAARKDGWDVHIAVPGGPRDARFKDYDFQVHDLEGRAFAMMGSIRSVVRAVKPDLVHAITIKMAFLTGLAAGRRTHRIFTIAGLGFLFSSSGIKPRLLRAVVKPFLKQALQGAAIIVQNPDDARTLVQAGLITDQDVRLIRGSGVDIKRFAPIKDLEASPPVVLMPTRLIREKGVAIFAQAAQILKASFKSKGLDVRCVIAGGLDDTNPHAITARDMQGLTADGALEWAGKIDDMARALNECALVAYPSWYGEGIPKVLLEAAACGKAIITTDHTGCREVVEHGVNGYLVPVQDAQALADAIEVILSNPDLRDGMGRKSRARAEREFNVDLIVRQTLDFCEEQLSRTN